jgi:hypothetical protein
VTALEVEVGRLRSALVRVVELLEDGAPDEAHAFAVAAAEPTWPPAVDRCRCEFCGARFEWPGLVEAHQFRSCSKAMEALGHDGARYGDVDYAPEPEPWDEPA